VTYLFQTVFSSGKNLEVMAMGYLVERGLVNYGDKVTKHWPEFGQNGKESVRIADVMRHEAGLPFFNKTIMLADLEQYYQKQFKTNTN
jgi:CubicO group peptidase (beta-lactamase class C family)